MYLLDTDTLTWAHVGNQRVAEKLRTAGEENVATTIISAIEILRGRQEYLLKAADGSQLLRAQQLLQRSQELLQEIQIISVDAAAAALFDRLRQNKKLKKIGRADLLIAGIALAHQAILVTRNVRQFHPVPSLRVENWMD